MKMLHYEYHDEVPDTMEELLKLRDEFIVYINS